MLLRFAARGLRSFLDDISRLASASLQAAPAARDVWRAVKVQCACWCLPDWPPVSRPCHNLCLCSRLSCLGLFPHSAATATRNVGMGSGSHRFEHVLTHAAEEQTDLILACIVFNSISCRACASVTCPHRRRRQRPARGRPCTMQLLAPAPDITPQQIDRMRGIR